MNKPTTREGFVSNAEPIEQVIEAPAAAAPAAPRATIPAPPAAMPEPEIEIPKTTWPIKVKLLHKEIRGPDGNMIKELTFREPTGGDINRYGNPCMVDQYGDVIILDRKMTTMMAALSGVLQPFIENMDPRDWNSSAYRLRGFFIPDPAAW